MEILFNKIFSIVHLIAFEVGDGFLKFFQIYIQLDEINM